ncbi:hypothetical protein AB6870_15760 [Rahnella inusitata]|uniref:hypothetical protein n=1 Tax=Rahnella inusitata TaxID=58169 RepID=UPI0039BE40E1
MNNQFSSNQKVTVLPTPDAVVHAAVDVKSTEQTQSPTSQVTGTDASERARAGRGAVLSALEYASYVDAAESVQGLPELFKAVDYRADELSHSYRSTACSRIRLDLRDITRDWQIHTQNDLDDLLGVVAAELVNKMNHQKRHSINRTENNRLQTLADKAAADYKVIADGYIQQYLLRKRFSEPEVQELLQMVADNKLGFVRSVVGDSIDVQAVRASIGTDWKAAVGEWASTTTQAGACSFSTGATDNVDGTSFIVQVRPRGKWILSVWSDGAWYPLQASPAALSDALSDRAVIDSIREAQTKPRPVTGDIFMDELQYEY